MAQVTIAYSVQGLALRVEAASDALGRLVDRLLKPYAVPSADDSSYVLRLVHEDPSARRGDESLPIFWCGVSPDGRAMIVRSGPGRRQIELVGAARADVDLARRRADVAVLPGAEGCLPEGCLLPILCDFLAHGGHQVVHAASLTVGAGDGRAALLVSGPSGSGKTTTALSLARAGMKLLADDVTFATLGPPDAPPRVWGLPTPCKVVRTTGSLLPWLAELPHMPGRADDEVLVDGGALAAPATTEPAPVRALVFLDPRNEQEHRLRPLDKRTALTRLARENLRAYETEADGSAGRAFAVLAALVRHAETVALSACPRVEGMYDVLIPLVGR